MKIKSLIILVVSLMLVFSCSSSAETEKELVDIIEQKEVKVISFSKIYAYVGEEVIIKGEKFGDDTTSLTVKLGNVNVEVVAVTDTQIKIKIPSETSLVPELNLSITNANVSFDDGFKNITILDNTKNKWIEMPHAYTLIDEIKDFRAINKEAVYFSLEKPTGSPSTSYPYEPKTTLNGGATINSLDAVYKYHEGTFIKGKQGGKYRLSSNRLLYKNAKDESVVYDKFPDVNFWGLGVFVDENEDAILVVSSEGRVFKSNDNALTFDQIYEKGVNSYEFEAFWANSFNHIWLAGFGNDDISSDYEPAKMLYLKDNTNWVYKSVEIENKEGNIEKITKINFPNDEIGYAVAEIYNSKTQEKKFVIIKSDTGGDAWSVIHETSKEITNFTFKNKDIGWYISGKEVYKTEDGGVSWGIDYTSTTDCKGILYNEDILWIISNEKILKYYF